tara:strand:- start:14428 stop:16326 length:1899 start_codon:yes stop_codon:yes gene_type:complete
MSSLGILYQRGLPLPMLLDAVAHAETGHLRGPERYRATSPKGARGMYQFMPGNLHDMGYKMPKNIPLSDVLNPTRARELAGKYITGYSDYHNMTSPLEKLVAYNMGPTAASSWMARGGNVAELPKQTRDYIKRAAKFINDQRNKTSNSNQGTQAMASPDGYDDARRAFFTEEEIAEAKRRGIDAYGMIAMRDSAYRTNPGKRRPDAIPSEITESRMPTPQQAAATQVVSAMLDNIINNPQGGNVTTQPGFADFMEGRRLAQLDGLGELLHDGRDAAHLVRHFAVNPFGYDYDYEAIPPALLNNNQFGHYMDGILRANPDVPPPVLVEQAVNEITEAERMERINKPLGSGGKSASLISQALASNYTQPAITGNPLGYDNAPPVKTTVPSAVVSSALAQSPANRRDQSPMAMIAPLKRGNINDLLIRMGSAGLRGAQTSGLESMAAMGDAYRDYYKDQNDMIAKYNAALAKANKGKKGGGGGSPMNGVIVNDALNRIDPLLSGWSTGIGSYLNMIPGSDAQKVKNLLATVKGNIGFDKLQAMRDASPTGGALGQVSERELTFLQSVFGSLEQDQSPEELRYNLQLLRYVYNSIIHGEGNHPYAKPGGAAPVASAAPAAASNNVSAARALVAGTP